MNRSLKQSTAFPVFYALSQCRFRGRTGHKISDETVYRDDFKLGRQMQMETVLATYEAWQVLMQENS